MNILSNKQGASLVIVLATMFFLLALGTSAFTAAGLNRGAGYVQRDRNQLELYASSMERAIIAELEQTWTATETSIAEQKDTLGGMVMLEAFKTGGVHVEFQPITIDGPSGSGGSVKYSVTITSTMSSLGGVAGESFTISRQPHVRCEREFLFNGESGLFDDPRVEPSCQPLVATINGELRVILTTEYTTPGEDLLKMETVATLRVQNIRLEEKWFSEHESGIEVEPNCTVFDRNAPGFINTFLTSNIHRSPPYNPISDTRMIITDGAVWEVLRHEKNAA